MIEGSAGIGKTRLLAEARAIAERLGIRALAARGSELEREPDPDSKHGAEPDRQANEDLGPFHSRQTRRAGAIALAVLSLLLPAPLPPLVGPASSAAATSLPRVYRMGDDLAAAGRRFQAWGFDCGAGNRYLILRYFEQPTKGRPARRGCARPTSRISSWTSGRSATTTSDSTPEMRPVAILLHGGGFILPEGPQGMVPAKAAARAAGYEPVDIDFTLGDPMQAWREVRDIAKRYKAQGRTVVAYGDSAGGNLAALLAQHNYASAAFVNSPPSNLMNWPYRQGKDPAPQVMGMGVWEFMNISPKERRFLSPKMHRSPNPIMVMATPDDTVVDYEMNRLWAESDPNVKLWTIQGEHTGGAGAVYAKHLARAMDFLSRKIGHEPPPGGFFPYWETFEDFHVEIQKVIRP